MCAPQIGLALAPTLSVGAQTALGYSTILGGIQAATTIQSQRNAAKTQIAVQKQASELERKRYLNEVSSLRMQQAQEQVAMAQRLQESTRKAMQAKATARVSAGEAGVSGLSVNALIADLDRQRGAYEFSETQNQRMTDANRTLRLRDAGLGFTTNMLRINKPVEQPNYANALLSGARTTASMYGVGRDLIT